MQTVASYFPLRTEAARQSRRLRRLWRHRIEVLLVFVANLTCTLAFLWLLVWLSGEMWMELTR